MSRPLITAWATVSNIYIDRLSGFHQRCAGVFLREDAGQIAVLPLHADRAAVHVLAVRSELYFSARRHCREARGDIDRRARFATLFRIGEGPPFKRFTNPQCLPHVPPA